MVLHVSVWSCMAPLVLSVFLLSNDPLRICFLLTVIYHSIWYSMALYGPASSLAHQMLYEVGQLFVCYVFDLDVSVKYLKVTFSYTQKSVKFRSGFIFYKNVN